MTLNKQKIIFTNGCFDLLHLGHIELIEFANNLYNDSILIIGLNSDDSIKRIKGKNRPIIKQGARAKILRNIKGVDTVIIFNEDTPEELIKKIKPDIIVKGGDYNGQYIIGSEIAEVRYSGLNKDFSTTKIIEKIRK